MEVPGKKGAIVPKGGNGGFTDWRLPTKQEFKDILGIDKDAGQTCKNYGKYPVKCRPCVNSPKCVKLRGSTKAKDLWTGSEDFVHTDDGRYAWMAFLETGEIIRRKIKFGCPWRCVRCATPACMPK